MPSGEVRPEVLEFDVRLIVAPVILAAIWHLTFQNIEPIDVGRFVDNQVTILAKGILGSA